MANEQIFYDDPNATINRDHCAGEVGGAATTVYGKFSTFAKTRLRAVHVRVTTAGTATTNKLDVYIGTGSVASVALSTSTAGSTFSTLIGSDVNSLQAVEVKTGADEAGKAVVTYEYSYDPAATITA